MDEKLQQIIAAMVANGESHDTITAVIERYKAENITSDVVEETEVVTEETAPAAEKTPAVEDAELVSEDISTAAPVAKSQASIMVGGNRVYLNEVIQSLQDQDNRPLEVQTKEYKDKVIEITKDTSLSEEQKDEQISSVLKPSYLTLESGTGDEAIYVPRPEVKKKMADNMPESIKDFETKEDLTSAINESIGKTIRDDEGIKALVEIQQFNKKDILKEKALEIQNSADLTTPEGVAEAKKEFNDFYAAEVYGEVQKSPAFNKIIKDLEVVGADVAGELNKKWGRYNDEFLRGIDESSFLSPGGIVESAVKGVKSFGSAVDKTMLSGEQLAFQKSDEELKDLEAKIENKSISLDDEINVRKQEVGISGRPTFTVENVKVKDRLEELKSKKENLNENIIEGLDKIKATDDYLALFTESPDVEGFGFEYALNAAKAAPSIIAEQAPQLIVGGLSVFGGPITAGIATAAMFTPMYAENYWGALTDGLRDDLGKEPEQKDYIKALEEGKYASQANSAAFAAIQTAAERFGAKKVLNSTFTKLGKNTMSGVGSLYKGEIKKFGKNALAKGIDMTEGAFTERLTESAQSFLNQVSVGTQTGGATDMFKYIDLDQINKEGEMGMIAGFFMPFGTNVARQSFVELKNSARDVATKFDLTSNIELAQADRFFKAAQENIDNKFKNGEITAEEKQIQAESLANTRNAGLKIPKKFGTQAKQKSFDLIIERQKLQDNVNKQDEAFTGPDKQRIKEINTELGNIQSVETATRSAVKAVEKADIDFNVIELENEANVESYLKENTNMAASKAKEAGKQRGFILEDGKTIIINKNVASKEGAVTTAAHEILHGVLFNTLNKGDESAFALANAIKMQLSNISTEDFKNSDLAARIEQYKADPNINEATKAEEVLTLFSEAIATGDIKFEEGVFTKLKDFVRRILQNAGFSNIDFNDSKDVYNFIKDYNKSVSKGKFTKAQVKAAKEGVVVSERLKDRVKDVAEKGVDETILKFSKSEVTDLARQYKKDPVNTDVEELIKQYDNVALKALGYDISKGTIAPEEAISFVNKEFDSILRRYDGSTEFSTWINSNIRPKRQAFYEEQIGKESETTSIDSEQARQVVDDSDVATDDRTEKEIRQAERKTKVAKRLKLEDKAIKEVSKKVKKIDLSKVNYKTLKNLANETIGEAFGISPNKILSNANLTKGEIASAQRYIKNNVDLLKALLPDGYNKDFKSTGVPKVLLDKFYNKRSVRSKTGAGLNVQNKKPNIGSVEFLEVFGFVEGKPTRDDRNISARIIALANQTGKAITNQTVREQLQKEGMPESALQDIKSGTPVGMFSLSTKPIQEELNELALIRDKNKIAKKLNFKADAIKESNRDGLIKMMLKAAKEGFMDKAVIVAGAMTSAGRQTFYGDKNNRFNGYTQAKKAGIKNIGKYFKTKDGNFYRFADAKVVDGVLQTFNLDNYKKQILEVDPSLWVAKPGNLYWGKDDPAYKDLLKEASDSPFDENGYKQIGISAKGEFIGKKALIKKLDKKVGNTEMTQSEINMKMLDHVVTQLAKAVENGMSMDIAGMIIIQSYQATGGLIKAAAPFEGISDVFEAGDKMETRSKKLYREEHNPPASVVGANLLWAIKNNAAKSMMKEVRKNFSQTILSKKDDSKLDIDYAATMPIGTNMSSNPIIRMAMAGINLNTVSDLRTGQTYADKFGLGVDNKFKNIENVAAQQNKLIKQVVLEGLNIKEAKKQLDQYLKIAPSQLKASKSTNTTLNDSKVLDVEGNLNIEDLLSKAAGIDEALSIARDINAPVKKIRVFDFDDTLAITKSNVLFTAPDGTEGSLTAEKFAMDGSRLLEEGYVFDFSEFNKVTKGKPGPLLDIAKKIQEARGTDDVFVLTARAPQAAIAIKEFLDSQGLNIPLKNITGLGKSTGEAKANWMIDKAAEGYNDFYFADDAYQNVKAVRDVMSVIDVKSKTQQAKFSLSEDLNSDFNKILENKSGIGAEKVYSDARAKTVGASKGKFKFFIPPSAEDFVGLLYPTLAKGKLGDQQIAWYKERLLNPFARAMENLSRDRINLMNDFKALKKELEVPKDLRKEAIDGFTNEQAVRVYLWNKQGLDIPGISKRDLKDLTEVIDKNPKLKVFADQLQAINKSEGYPAPQESWLVGTITTDLINGLNTVKRAKYLEEWQTNADIIFSKENLNKMEAIHGPKYREAMENILSRMKTGKNRLFSESRIGNQVLDYINGSIGAIMFFNTRSAVLQTISSINFINWSDNNIYKAGKAFANQPQYWKDFTTLMNSDFLKDRRQGLKLNISESEIADAAKTSKNKAKAALNYILQKGFLPTQIADSFAIASGGATFYRNKINALVKKGMSQKEAEEIAYREFREIAEESQQSSRPDKISQQQASNVGRVILAFANTPSQYARIIKKAASDLKNKRGDWKNNISKIVYYGAMQNLIFNVLQQALFAVGFGDDEEESKEREKKYISIGNGMVDSLLRGLGYGGAAVAVAKNLLLDIYERSKRDRPEYVDAAWKLLDFSPPIDSKVSKLKAAGYMVDKYGDDIIDKGFAIDNPAYEAASKVVSATTNVPLDRVFTKANNISAAMGEDAEVWQRVAMMLGWPEWQIKPKPKKKTYTLLE